MNDMQLWSAIRAKMEPDGALRDVYVWDGGEPVWDRFLASLAASPYQLEFTLDAQPQPRPVTFAEAYAMRRTATPLLRIFVLADMVLHCHFFNPDEIELDFVPRDVSGFARLEPLLAFLRWLAADLGTAVAVTAESMPQAVIFAVYPDGSTEVKPE